MQLICNSLLLLLLAAQAQAAGPGALRGRVLDPEGAAAAGSMVTLLPGAITAETDSEGRFSFPALPPGGYSVSASHPAFERSRPAEVRLAEGETRDIDLQFRLLRATHVQLDVIGQEPEAALAEIPGSAHLVSREELESYQSMDANEVLRAIPGVNVREDSGPAGMRLNIGVRGLNPDRSRTLLVLEDGLPLSLAPYGEPEMYYSPPIERMSGIELLKGSGSILHGPQTIGGVLNFLTPDPPPRTQGTLEATGGQRGFFTGQASFGGTRDNTGWYLSALRKQGDGWRDFFFDINDFLAKVNVNLSERQRLGVKLGFYDERSNSTYLGLTQSQFVRDANFNAVPDDLLKVRRYSGSLLHQYTLSPRALVSSSLFAYTTARNWRRQDFDRARRPGVTYLQVLGDPSIPGDALFLRDSTGNNNREFDVAGAETRLSAEHGTFGVRQRLETGVRYVYEEHRDRRIDGSTYAASSGVIREDEVRNGNAVSFFVQNRLFLSRRWTVTPGLRLENYDYRRNILRQPVNGVPADVRIRRGDSVFKPIPGLGVAYQAAGALTLFGGVHRGFAPPRVKDAITRAGVSLLLDAELSWNWEAGARLSLPRGARAEATWFATEFQNQIIPAAQSGGATTTLINGGETSHRGVEGLLAIDWKRLAGAGPGLYTEARFTWLPVARFGNGIYRNNRLPYAPRHNLALRTGYRHPRGLAMHVEGVRVGEQFGDNIETVRGSADGTVGLLPDYWVWNVAAGHTLKRERVSIEPFFTIKNLADARYISSRAPLGIQPGLFRQANAGVKFRF